MLSKIAPFILILIAALSCKKPTAENNSVFSSVENAQTTEKCVCTAEEGCKVAELEIKNGEEFNPALKEFVEQKFTCEGSSDGPKMAVCTCKENLEKCKSFELGEGAKAVIPGSDSTFVVKTPLETAGKLESQGFNCEEKMATPPSPPAAPPPVPSEDAEGQTADADTTQSAPSHCRFYVSPVVKFSSGWNTRYEVRQNSSTAAWYVSVFAHEAGSAQATEVKWGSYGVTDTQRNSTSKFSILINTENKATTIIHRADTGSTAQNTVEASLRCEK